MTLTAAAIRLLADKGLTALDIADVAEAMQPVRSANAERQQRYRDNKRNVTRNVTPPNDIYSNPPELNPSEAKASLAPRGKKQKAGRLPDDWEPEPLTGETAGMVLVWQAGRLERELAKFRDYWRNATGRRAAKPDWQAAYRNWLRNADDWNQGKQNGQSGSQNNGMGSTERAARQALHELSGGAGRFDEGGAGLPAGELGAGYRIIDAVPDTLRAIGHVQ